jgi:UDP-N-acetyl-D-glucosamine dehydrogenase
LKQNVVVVGQGYVGLPLAIAAANAGYDVIGIDSDDDKVKQLNSGYPIIEDITQQEINDVLVKNRYRASVKLNPLEGPTIYLICVPTPLDSHHKPDMSHIQSAAKTVAKVLKPGDLVILESTVKPGATRNYLLPILVNESGLDPKSFHLAFSPERIDPRNEQWNLRNTPKIISGIDEKSMLLAIEFYSKFIEKLVKCDSLEIAEMAKLLENTFRLINISFVNELSVFCNTVGIDITKVIAAATTKPYGFTPFYPSIGIGGHCIPVDPVYLLTNALDNGASLNMVEAALNVNNVMPRYFASWAEKEIGSLNEKKILVIGVAYKANISDVRETPVESLVLELKTKGANVSWHDDLVKVWKGEKSVELSDDFDLAIIAARHDYIDLTKIGKVPILNLRGSN